MAYYETYIPNESGELQRVVINAGVGFCLPFYGETAPPGTLACDGSEISREAYKELFAVLGTKAGAGDGATTFNLPDFRGDFIRCVGGNAAELGVEQGDAIRDISGRFASRIPCTDTGTTAYLFIGGSIGPFKTQAPQNGNYQGTAHNGFKYPVDGTNAYQEMVFDISGITPTAAENRPVNVALLWCIIYE